MGIGAMDSVVKAVVPGSDESVRGVHRCVKARRARRVAAGAANMRRRRRLCSFDHLPSDS